MALLLVTIVVSSTEALTAQPTRSYRVSRVAAPTPQLNGRWGDRLATAGNLNGDRVKDIWVGVYREDLPGAENAGRVYAISGKNGSVLYRIDSPEPQGEPESARPQWAGFGWGISNLGDVDRDGRNDLVAGSVRHDVYTGTGAPCGAPEPNGCNENQGKAWVFSGRTGRLLYALDNPSPQGSARNPAHFGWGATAGDVNRDGVSEVLIGATGNDFPAGCGDRNPLPAGCRIDQGQAFIFNGKNGRLIRTLNVPSEDRDVTNTGACLTNCGGLGIVAQGPGDVNRDRVADQLVSAWTYNFPTGPNPQCFAQQPVNCNPAQGRLYVYSGTNGRVLRKIDNPEPQANARLWGGIAEAFAPGDVNRDGFADIFGQGFQQNGPAGEAQGKGWVFSGRTGRALYSLNDPSPEPGGQFAYALAKTNYNRDRFPDLYLGSSPHHVPGTPQSGGTYVFNGRNGRLLRAFELPQADRQHGVAEPRNVGPNMGRAVAAPGDVNGDRQPDYVTSAPNLDVGQDVDQGVVYFFRSRKPARTRSTARPRRATR
ncbi:MAG: integrin alpha [Actinomycetota bacterium]|nr:integrin alpha [Actinomycetota bacterium]